MYEVSIVTNVAKDRDNHVQLQTEVKRGTSITATVQEVAPELYDACIQTLSAGTELLKSSETGWTSRFSGEESVEDCLILMAGWHGEAIVHDRWMLRSRLQPWIHAQIYVVSPHLSLVATSDCTLRGSAIPCGVILQFGSFSRLSVAKIATLFPDSQHPDSWMEGFNVLSLLGPPLYCLQDRFSEDMTILRDKLSEEIRRADVTIVDCEAVWEYFRCQFQEFTDQKNKDRWEKLTEGLG